MLLSCLLVALAVTNVPNTPFPGASTPTGGLAQTGHAAPVELAHERCFPERAGNLAELLREYCALSGVHVSLSAVAEGRLGKIDTANLRPVKLEGGPLRSYVEGLLVQHGFVVAELYGPEPLLLGVWSTSESGRGAPYRHLEPHEVRALSNPALLVQTTVPVQGPAVEVARALQPLVRNSNWQRITEGGSERLLFLQGSAAVVSGWVALLGGPGAEARGGTPSDEFSDAEKENRAVLQAARSALAVLDAFGVELNRFSAAPRAGSSESVLMKFDLLLRGEPIEATRRLVELRERLGQEPGFVSLTEGRNDVLPDSGGIRMTGQRLVLAPPAQQVSATRLLEEGANGDAPEVFLRRLAVAHGLAPIALNLGRRASGHLEIDPSRAAPRRSVIAFLDELESYPEVWSVASFGVWSMGDEGDVAWQASLREHDGAARAGTGAVRRSE